MDDNDNRFATIVLNRGVPKPLDYKVVQGNPINLGSLVEVPLRNRLEKGVVVELKSQTTVAKVLPISRVIDSESCVTQDLLQLMLWMAEYYATSLGKILKLMLPSSVRSEFSEKKQLKVCRNISLEEMRKLCIEWRVKKPKQVAVLETLLRINKEIFLSELLESASVSRAVVKSLEVSGIIVTKAVSVNRSPLEGQEFFLSKPKVLNSEQKHVLEVLSQAIEAKAFHVFLVHGVTGSGKTEVYLQAIQKTLDANKQVLMLVPEIALTTQTIERFRGRFEGKIAILHCKLSEGERYDEWRRIHRGEASIVIGARSAIFSPLNNVGLIIVDEEHENSYKQTESQPCYQGRDVAIMRAKYNNAVVILGSATPSLESYYNAKTGKYTLLELSNRADQASMPSIQVVDMRLEYEKHKGYTLFSDALLDGIKKRFERGEQVMLFLNRRGYHTSQMCQSCGQITTCPHCSAALTFHYRDQVLLCHLCGHEKKTMSYDCLSCHGDKTLKFKGVGTQQVERALKAIFPEIRTLRMDADTTRHKGAYDKLYRQFVNQKSDVLIGTQMIAKGLHFPAVTLVSILNADHLLQLPDFKAQELAFQLIVQVAGRSGRGNMPGEVIMQTSIPHHPLIKLAIKQDYQAFFDTELALRKAFFFPPSLRMVKYGFIGSDESLVRRAAENIAKHMRARLGESFHFFDVMPAGQAKVQDRYRYQFFISGKSVLLLHSIVHKLPLKELVPSTVQFYIDTDPLSNFF